MRYRLPDCRFDRQEVHDALIDDAGNVVSSATFQLDMLPTPLDSTGEPFGARGSDAVTVISEGEELPSRQF